MEKTIIKHYCDRCGKEIAYDYNGPLRFNTGEFKGLRSVDIAIGQIPPGYQYVSSYDLCDKCWLHLLKKIIKSLKDNLCEK